jgi:3-hydroxymyristoyl/3-hydroxydecanoyl-(acyl carrier protein) dehydratase
MQLPHRFPFVFASRTPAGRVAMSLSAGAWWSRGQAAPRTLGLEILAQAVLCAVSDDRTAPVDVGRAESADPFLAALEQVRFHRDLDPGESLTVEFEREAGLGRLHRFRTRLLAEGVVAVEATLIVGL